MTRTTTSRRSTRLRPVEILSAGLLVGAALLLFASQVAAQPAALPSVPLTAESHAVAVTDVAEQGASRATIARSHDGRLVITRHAAAARLLPALQSEVRSRVPVALLLAPAYEPRAPGSTRATISVTPNGRLVVNALDRDQQ